MQPEEYTTKTEEKTKLFTKRKNSLIDTSKCENVEEEIITEEIKNIVKKIKEKRPNVEKEIIPEEKIYEFDVEKYPIVSPTILRTSKTINEAIAQQEAVELSTDINNVSDKAKISVVTRIAAESTVIHGEEKEEVRKESKDIRTFKASSVLELNESYSIDHPDTQSPLEDIVEPFEIVPCVAKKDVLPKESITISEIYPDQTLGVEDEYRQENKEAKITVIPHSQKIVTEFIASTKEGEIKHEVIPQMKKAIQDFVEHESINVEEVNEAHAEKQLKEDIKPTPVKSTVKYPLNKQLTVSELHSEIQPENYYPEIIVPTEVADKLIVPSKNAITTFEIEASETETKFNQIQSPISYTADVSIIPEKCVQVSESNIQEKETKLPDMKIPDMSFAAIDIVAKSSIIVSSVDEQESEDTFTSHLPESHTAILTLNNASKVCTSSITEINEVESDLKIPIIPEKKNIESSVLSLEVLGVTEVIANESETEFLSYPTLEIKPNTGFIENQSCVITEITANDFPTDLITCLNYKMDKAVPSFEEVEAKQISHCNVQESDVPLDKTSIPISVKPETSYTPIQCLTVEQTFVGEREEALVVQAHPESHKSIKLPTHTLQVITVEEITPENSVKNYNEDEIQPRTVKANVNFVDDQSIVVKEVSAFESESNLTLDNRPKNVHAQPTIIGHDVAETTEVLSNDTTKQLNIEKYLTEKAKLEHVPHEAFISEVTSANEVEDIWEKKEEKQPISVNVTIDEIIGINVTEQPVYEKELISVEQINQNTKNATPEIVPIEIAYHSEIVTGDYISDFIQPDVFEMHAHHEPSTFESVISYETDVSEKEQIMPDKKSPKTCSAITSMVVKEAVEITEIISDDRPKNISDQVIPKEETAMYNLIPLKPLEHQDIMICESVDKVKVKQPITAVAHVSQKPLHSLETSLIVSADSENLLSEFLIPDSKVAETNYAELDIPISVIEILTQDKEVDFKTNEIPSQILDREDIILEESHITSETMVCSSTSDFNESVPKSVYAIKSNNPQSAIELLEIAPLEKEGNLSGNDEILKKHADFTYEEVKGVEITEQVQLETKDELVIENKPAEKKSNITITGQDVAETLETKVESPIEELKIEFPKQELATTIQDKKVHGFEVSEVIIQESGSSLQNDQQYIPKTVNISIEDNTKSYIVTEVIPKEKEGEFSKQPKPIYHYAEPKILSHEGLQINETNISICEEKLNDFQYSTKIGSRTIEPLECLVVSEVNIQELEENIHSDQPQVKHATKTFDENVGLIIKSTVTNERENELIIDKFKTKTATEVSNLIDYKAPENFEETKLESVKPIEGIKEDFHQASSEHILLEGISTTIINTQDNEITFDQPEKTAEKTASLKYDTRQTVNVTEVLLGESESDLVPTPLLQKHNAVKDMAETKYIASSFEVITQNDADDLYIQKLPSVINIMPQSIESHSVEIAETICHETETPFNTVKSLTKTCNFAIQTDQNIEVTEIVANEIEEILEINEKHKRSEANIVFDENQTVLIEEIETSDNTIPLTENNFKPLSAEKHVEPFTELSVTEVRPEEFEVAYENQLIPPSKCVNPTLLENKSLNVISTIAVEKESILSQQKPEITQTAQLSSVYSPKSVVQLEENIVQTSTTVLNITKPNEIFIESSQIPYDSINQTEISPFEKESTFNVISSEKQEVANVQVNTFNIIDTMEIITGDKESIYVPSTKPNIKKAAIEINDCQPVSKIFEIKPEDSSSELNLPVVAKCLATPGQELVHSVVITDNAIQDKEGLFEGEFKPSPSVAEINIENEKEIKTITEVISQEMEGSIEKLNMPSAKKAQIEITSGQDVAEKTEILSNIALGTLTDVIFKSSTAVSVQDTFESIQSTITISEDKEKPLYSNLVYEKSKAQINLEESKSLNVTQVVVEDKEGKYIIPDLPKTQIAKKNILPTEALETSFVTTDVHVTTFDKFEPNKELANILHETLNNIVQSETNVHESEKYFPATETKSKNAELKIIPNKSLTITEVITDDNDEQLLIKHEQKPQQVTTSLSTLHELPQISETVSSVTTKDVVIPEINTDFAEVSQTELHNSTISTEIQILEKENNFTQIPKFDEFKAQVNFKEDKSLNVSETVFNEVEQTFEIIKPTEKQASLIQSTIDVPTILENSTIEKEQYFTSKVPESQTINVIFENNFNLQVSEVQTADKENDLITSIEETQTAAIPELNTRPVVNITEVITSMNVKDLPQITEPEYVRANETHLTCQSLLQTEMNISESESIFEVKKEKTEKAEITTDTLENIISIEPLVSEKEGVFNNGESPEFKHANISLEEIKSSVIVSNIESEDKETEMVIKPKRKTSIAKVVSDNFEAITRTEQQISEKECELNLDTPKDRTAYVTFENTQSSIIVSDVIPEDKEENLIVANETYSTANIITENYKSIINNEHIISEKEDNFTLKPKPDKITASISIEKARKGVIVSEVTSHEKENNLKEIPTRKTSLAKVSAEELKSFITTETQILSSVNELLLPQLVKENTVEIKLDELKHLTIEELVSTESESMINDKQPLQCNITPTILELLPLESNEIISETQPIEIDDKKPLEDIAQLGQLKKNKSIQINENVILETVNELKQDTLDKHRASITDITISEGKTNVDIYNSLIKTVTTKNRLDKVTFMYVENSKIIYFKLLKFTIRNY